MSNQDVPTHDHHEDFDPEFEYLVIPSAIVSPRGEDARLEDTYAETQMLNEVRMHGWRLVTVASQQYSGDVGQRLFYLERRTDHPCSVSDRAKDEQRRQDEQSS